MAKTLEEYRLLAQKEAKKNSNAYARERQKQADEEARVRAASIEAEAEADIAGYREEQAQTQEKYREIYDENAVKELITRRRVAETMENYGLGDSGAKVTGQAAAVETRRVADKTAKSAAQATVEELNRLITQTRTKAQTDTAKASASIQSAAQKDMASYEQKQLQQAESRARYNYEAAQKNSVSKQRASYAELLIRQKYPVADAWKEAYRRYPAEKGV